MDIAAVGVHFRCCSGECVGRKFYVRDALWSQCSRHDHFAQTMRCSETEFEVACEGWLNIRVYEQDAITKVCQQTREVCGICGFANATLGGDNGYGKHDRASDSRPTNKECMCLHFLYLSLGNIELHWLN